MTMIAADVPQDGQWYVISLDDRAMSDVSARTTDGVLFDVHLRDAMGKEVITIDLASGVTWERMQEIKREALEAARRRRARKLLDHHSWAFVTAEYPWTRKYL